MVFDLALDEDGDIYLNHRGDLATVDGQEGLEQAVLINLLVRYNQIIEDHSRDTVLTIIELEAERVVDELDDINSVAGIGASFDDENPEKLLVEIVYDTGSATTLEVE